MKNKWLLKLIGSVCLILVLVALTFVGACAKPAPAPETRILKIGNPDPLSGPVAVWGVQHTRICETFCEIVNEDGGITVGGTTYTVKHIAVDDKYTPEGAKAAADRLVYTEKVNAIVGGWTPINAEIYGKECAKANIVYINVLVETVKAPSCSPEWPTSFSFRNNMIQNQRMVIPMLKEKVYPDIKRVALLSKDDVIGGVNLEYVLGAKEEWKEKYGLEIVYDSLFPMVAEDMTPWILDIKKLDVDCIYRISAIVTNTAMLAKQSHELGLDVPIVTQASLTNIEQFIAAASYEGAQNVHTEGTGPLEYGAASAYYQDMTRRVMKRYEEKYGDPLTYVASFSWDTGAAALYLEAVKKANSIKAEDVIRVLETEELSHFYGTTKACGEKTYGIRHRHMIENAICKVEGDSHVMLFRYGEDWP